MGLWQQQVTFLPGWAPADPQLLSPAQRGAWELTGGSWRLLVSLELSGFWARRPSAPCLGMGLGEGPVTSLHFLGYWDNHTFPCPLQVGGVLWWPCLVTCLHSASEDARGAGHREQEWSSRGSPGLWDNSCQEEDYGLVANKRRSYSFTSGTALVSLSLPGRGTTDPEGRHSGAPASTQSHIPASLAAAPHLGRADSACCHLALPTDCSLLQPPTRRSPRCPCPRSQWRPGAATRSHCTLGSRHQPCPGHAATPSWPSRRAHGTRWGRRPLVPLALRTNPSSRSSLGRRSEPQLRERKAPACFLSSSQVLSWHSLCSQHQLTACCLSGGREAVASGSAPASPGAAPCPSHQSPGLSPALSTPPAPSGCSP